MAALFFDNGSGLLMAGFSGDAAPRALFLCVVVGPKMLRVMTGTHQKQIYAVGWFY